MIKVLFICLGNICRSPTAEGIFRQLVADRGLLSSIYIDSAGTSGWHNGQPPDKRSQTAAQKHNIDISHQKSREITTRDFEIFDYLIAMDKQNLEDLQKKSKNGPDKNIATLLSYSPKLDRVDVPDPYYHGSFDDVFDMIKTGCDGLLEKICETHKL